MLAARETKSSSNGRPESHRGLVRRSFSFAHRLNSAQSTRFSRISIFRERLCSCLCKRLAVRELIQRAYEEAIREEYRFFSYGDAMLIT